MTEIERLAANDDNALCNQADMTFQHTLAEASGLTRIGPMLQLLGQQVRMFIAVVGINYAFPIEPIVERNRAILAAIDEGNEELAAQRWREKIDEALAYMLEQVEAAHEVRRVTAGGPRRSRYRHRLVARSAGPDQPQPRRREVGEGTERIALVGAGRATCPAGGMPNSAGRSWPSTTAASASTRPRRRTAHRPANQDRVVHPVERYLSGLLAPRHQVRIPGRDGP